MDLAAVLSNIKTATEVATWFRENSALEKSEARLKAADLLSALADVKLEIARAQQELVDKDAAILQLREQLSMQAEMLWETPAYWRQSAGKKDGPFCQRCYDKDAKLIRLQSWGRDEVICLVCESHYETGG